MAHAFGTQVEIDLATADQNQDLLRSTIVPHMKSRPGFVRGVWVRSADGTTAMGIVVFDTEQNAKAAGDSIPTERPANAPRIVSSGVYEVMAEA